MYARKSNALDSIFVNSSKVKPTINQENNNMTQSTVGADVQAIFEARRVWEAKSWGKRVDATREEINTWSAKGQFMKAFNEGRIRITQDANASRKDGIPAIYSNKVQDAELGAALAIWEVMPYYADVLARSTGLREIALIDTELDHDICVIEEMNAATNKIGYRVHYGQKVYDHLNTYLGMRHGAVNPVQNGIDGALNGWTDKDGVIHEGYNQWVDKHNLAVMNFAKGVATEADQAFLKNVTPSDDMNRFAQVNTVKHVSYDSIANHYVLSAWMFMDNKDDEGKTVPAFELFTWAKTAEQFEAFLSRRDSNLNYGYQRQMRKMAGIAYAQIEA